MTTINNATSSPPIAPAGSPLAKPGSGAADVTTSTNASTSNATNTAANATTGSSVTSLSTISTQLQAAQAATASDAVFSTSKVNEIKLAISEGRFQVNSEKVANALLDSVHDLLGSRQRG
jgi:negative regulator of flagellin synthesis FlgM